MIYLLLLTVLGLLIYSAFNYFYSHFRFWQRQGVPSESFLSFEWATKPYHQTVLEGAKKHGKVFGAYQPFQKVLFVNDAKLARDLSIKEFHKFPIRNSFHAGTTNLNKSLFFMEANDDWKRIRSIVTPAFTSGKLRQMLTPIERITQNFIEHMRPLARSGQEFDLKQYIGGFTMDVIASCAYGIELDSVKEPNHPVVVNAKKILNVDAPISMVVSNYFPTLARLLRLEPFNKEAINFFDDLTFQIVEKRMQNRNMKQNPDLLGLMIENSNVHHQNGTNQKLKGISKDEMAGQGIVFFIAGFDTTHATFDHIIFHLTKNPEWQEKLYQELYESRDNLDYSKLIELPILNTVINESLRICPPLVEFERESIADCTLLDTGIKIPKSTLISIQPIAIHHNPEYFPDPLAFKPERFLVDKTQSAESNYAFMPFGVGPRQCVGMRFAQNELRIGLANFVLNYKVTGESDQKLEYFKGSVLMSPKQVLVRISER